MLDSSQFENELNLEDKLHRTWIQALIDSNHKEAAALIVDGELNLVRDPEYQDWFKWVYVRIPHTCNRLVVDNQDLKQILESYFYFVANGNLKYDENDFYICFTTKLLDIEEDWKNKIKYLIANSKDLNQGLITEKARQRGGKEVIMYNEMKFASASEVRIAQELEARKILFFPLPLAVRNETGDIYKDHREVDFLVCLNGVWGILEVSYHPDRYEKDAEKDAWFKKSGILCVEHRSAERCYNQPKTVVGEFLTILSQHKR